MRRFMGVALVVALLAGSAILTASGAAAPVVRGITITGYTWNPTTGDLEVRAKWWGWKMYPKSIGKKPNKSDGGHWAVFVNGNRKGASATARVKVKKLPAGKPLKVFLRLENNNNTRVEGAKPSTVVTIS